jgi:hypothetical protein
MKFFLAILPLALLPVPRVRNSKPLFQGERSSKFDPVGREKDQNGGIRSI